MEEYISKAKITNIHFISRASVKIGDNFYTVEYGEDRQVNFDEVNINRERDALINDCNIEVDRQLKEIYDSYEENKRNRRN